MNAADVLDRVVAQLVDAIEAGAADWQMPWRTLGSTGWPTNAATGNRYSGGNVLALYLAAIDRGFPTARWATYRQWASLGAQVRKSERGTLGVFWKVTDPTDDQRDDTDVQTPRRRSAWARTFTVFNAGQVDSDPAGPQPAATLDVLDRDASADAFFAAIPAVVHWGAGNPRYRPAADDVVMPAFDAFHSAPDAYGTLAHDPLTAPVGPIPGGHSPVWSGGGIEMEERHGRVGRTDRSFPTRRSSAGGEPGRSGAAMHWSAGCPRAGRGRHAGSGGGGVLAFVVGGRRALDDGVCVCLGVAAMVAVPDGGRGAVGSGVTGRGPGLRVVVAVHSERIDRR